MTTATLENEVKTILATMSEADQAAYWEGRKKNDEIAAEQVRRDKAIKFQTELENAQAGDGATHCGYSDRRAGTIIRKTAKTMWVQQDTAKLLNGANSGEADALVMTPGGFSAHTEGEQRYEYTRNPEGEVIRYSRREYANGTIRWMRSGVKSGCQGEGIIFGRHEHYDFNF